MTLPDEFRFKVERLDPMTEASVLQGELNRHAAGGWEFVGTIELVSGDHLVFKRID